MKRDASTMNAAGILRTQALVGGQWRSGAEGFAVRNPATGEVLAEVANMGERDALDAIAAAEAARADWTRIGAKGRSQALRRWFDALMAHQDELARIMTAEQGKPLAEARGEIAYAASFVEWFAEQAKRANGEVLPSWQEDRRLFVFREPVGVCAAITPWNFPLAMLTRKVAPALAAGCTAVVKPAEQTPLTALAAAALAMEAGIPPGVLNVLSADAQRSVAIGSVLCAHPLVRHLSFTGSTEVGRILMAQCAPTLKKLSLELGGNAPFIVFDDADLDAAVEGAFASKYRNAGQTCVCANRFYVQDGIHDAFVEALAARVKRARIGNGMAEGVELGPLIDEAAVMKVQRHVQDALAQGARLVTGGRRVEGAGALFFQPTVITGARAGMLCAGEETFGPLAPVFRFTREAEAIAAANDTPYGLAAYFYTRDAARVFRVTAALQYGMVGANTGLISTEQAPFGGIKQSGFGREGSEHGMDEYLEMKYLNLGGVTA